MRYAAAFLSTLITFGSCVSCFHLSIPSSYEYGTANQYASSYTFRIDCLGGGVAFGNAVAVSPRHLVTAKHVLLSCQSRGRINWRMRVRHHKWIEVIDGNRSATHDVAILDVVGSERLPQWSRLSAREPKIGERVCKVTSTPVVERIRKCGDVFSVGRGQIAYAIHTVPGNSGGPIYDRGGNVVGIIRSGRWKISDELFGMATMPESFKEIWP